MKNDIYVKNGIIIPDHEIEISTSRAGGPGGQHVNKTETKITVRWNVTHTQALTDEQKARVAQNLQAELTTEGDLIIHSSASRSQQQNKDMALARLAEKVRKALFVPKKRIKTKVAKRVKEARFESKMKHSKVKKMRSKRWDE